MSFLFLNQTKMWKALTQVYELKYRAASSSSEYIWEFQGSSEWKAYTQAENEKIEFHYAHGNIGYIPQTLNGARIYLGHLFEIDGDGRFFQERNGVQRPIRRIHVKTGLPYNLHATVDKRFDGSAIPGNPRKRPRQQGPSPVDPFYYTINRLDWDSLSLKRSDLQTIERISQSRKDIILYNNRYVMWNWKSSNHEVKTSAKSPLFHSPGVTEQTLANIITADLDFIILSEGFGDRQKSIRGQLPYPVNVQTKYPRIEVIQVKSEQVKDLWNSRVHSGKKGVALIHTTC